MSTTTTSSSSSARATRAAARTTPVTTTSSKRVKTGKRSLATSLAAVSPTAADAATEEELVETSGGMFEEVSSPPRTEAWNPDEIRESEYVFIPSPGVAAAQRKSIIQAVKEQVARMELTRDEFIA